MNALREPEIILEGAAPVGRQIRDQLRQLIASGSLRPGEQLPTVRAMAVQLAVNPHAVSQAYDELCRDGYLTAEDGSGVFVASAVRVREVAAARQARLEMLCAQFLTGILDQGFSAAEVLGTAQALLRKES